MRIIAGEWGGQPLPSKPSANLRPTSDKVREAIFSQLEAKHIRSWPETEVLDLFSGTGALAFEALSRGAHRAVLVDHHLSTVKMIESAAKTFETQNRIQVLCKGALEAIRWLHARGDTFDVIFLDPPYRQDWIVATLSALHNFPLLKKNGIVVAEHDKREVITSVEAIWKQEGARRYGDTAVTLLKPQPL